MQSSLHAASRSSFSMSKKVASGTVFLSPVPLSIHFSAADRCYVQGGETPLEHIMSRSKALPLAAVAPLLVARPAWRETVPRCCRLPDPGARLCNPKLGLAKVADGVNDPTGVSIADNSFDRILCDRARRPSELVTPDGKLLPELFFDLTETNHSTASADRPRRAGL